MQHIKQLAITSLTLLFAVTVMASFGPTRVYADAVSTSRDAACQGAALGGTSPCGTNGGVSGLDGLLSTAINVLSIIIGVAAVVMVILGGLRYVLSAGDSQSTNTAKNTILYALIGLTVAAFAQILVHFVLHRVNTCPTGFTGTPSTGCVRKK